MDVLPVQEQARPDPAADGENYKPNGKLATMLSVVDTNDD